MRVLVTGSSGHLARTVLPRIRQHGHTPVLFDLPARDILNPTHVQQAALASDACIHLAGMKYADRAELEPLEAVNINIQGTANVIDAFGANAVIASTCKAADPETVYGSTKLIAERIALSAGAKVVRFVNVLGSAGSVTDIWDAIPRDQPIPVCVATRLFMSAEQAADLIVSALEWPTGRYGPRDIKPRRVLDVAMELHPGRQTVHIPLRRGDRKHERLLAACEFADSWDDTTVRITGQHDSMIPVALSYMAGSLAA
jgi:UDP-N-acetylglucosamine 4,6-dehydratase/5-epimerase